jgi:hypothetical protein
MSKKTRPLHTQFSTIVVIVAVFLFQLFSNTGFSQENNPLASQSEAAYMAVFDSVMASGKYIEKLDSGSFYNLPLGILGGDNHNPDYAILIDEVVLHPQKATFSASMVLTNPFDNNRMVFVAKEVPFTFSGGIQGTIRLELISEKPVSVCDDIGLEILKGSYVEADCQGFRSLHIKGKFELNEEKYTLADANGKTLGGKVSSFFETTVQDWNDLAFSLSVEPFQLKKYPDYTFMCQDLSVDFSDLKNPSALQFPKGYTPPYPASMVQLWRGVYIKQAKLILNPDKFENRESNEALAFGVENMIIDELGFTGKAVAENLLTLEQGSLAGWNFSISKLHLDFIMNDLTGGGLEGLIHVPVFEDSTNFQYKAYVDIQGNYGFNVSPDDTLSFTMFGQSKLDLYKTSYINIKSDSNGFVPTACFNGKMTINGKVKGNNGSTSGKGSAFKLADIEFQEFKVSTQAPLVDIKYMAYHGTGQGKLSKFPVTIKEVAFSSSAADAKLSITAAVNLKKDSEEGFSGSTTIDLLARREEYKYKFDGVQVGMINIKVEKPKAFSIEGTIAFARGDSIYGDGFRGSLDASFAGRFDLQADALFGNVDGYRYFYVDGMFAMKPGIQAGPITIFGFGGGLYHHMRQMPGASGPQYEFGRTTSNLVYRPDNNIALGIKAGVTLGMGSEQALNAQARFEIAFTKSAGISYIAFQGKAQCITPPLEINAEKVQKLAGSVVQEGNDSPANSPNTENKGAITASLNMFQDFENDEFHADMEIFVNVGGLITGIGSGNRAGWAVAHVTPEEWYIHIGTPTDPIGLSFINLVKMHAYFMAGHRMPATLPIHPKVVSILGISPEDVAGKRDENSLSAGRGIAFGAGFDISTGDQSFLIFYGSFSLGAGFDIMLGDYGEEAFCEGSAPPLGINGWYATGQAYAYFSGKIGIQAKVFKKVKKFEILSIATAAFLKAEAPNPVWMVGIVGGEYRLLNGMIKGSCKFEVEVGERCDVRGKKETSALSGLPLIGDVTPSNSEDGVDVFTTPQVVFNVPVEAAQKIAEDDGTTTWFRVKLEELSMAQENQEVPFETKWNTNKDVVQVIPGYVLYPETKYSLKVRISFEEKVGGIWKAFEADGKVLTEEKTVDFKTGELPDRIPSSEVAYSYPIDRQFNFLQGEYEKAYLMFRRDLHVFFGPSEKYTKKARWTYGRNSTEQTPINYNASEKTLYMDLPKSMQLNTIYALELVAIPIVETSAIDRNVSETYTGQETGHDSNSVDIKTRQAEGTITTTEEKTMYNLDFKTSQYADFDSRFSTGQVFVRGLYDAGYMEFLMFSDMPGDEGLDIYEQPKGSGYSLIQAEADLSNTAFFTEYVNPRTYEKYPWFDYHAIQWRDTAHYGLKAQKAITAGQPIGFTSLTDADIAAGHPVSTCSYSDIIFKLPYYWDEDYMQIRDYLAFQTRATESTDPVIQTILNNIKLRAVRPGDYPITLKYVLPGKNETTSSKTITITSTIKTDEADF